MERCQLSLFTPEIEEQKQELIKAVLESPNILERISWTEFHANGQLWIKGEIGIVSSRMKHLYNFRTGFEGYEGIPVCRLGVWTKFFDNGQIAWSISYNDYGYFDGTKSPSYRKDGTGIYN